MFALALQAASEGLTLSEIIADIPHDFGALVVYVLVGLFVFFVWYGSSPRTSERYRAGHAADQSADDVPESEAGSPARNSGSATEKSPLSSGRKRRSSGGADPTRVGWIG